MAGNVFQEQTDIENENTALAICADLYPYMVFQPRLDRSGDRSEANANDFASYDATATNTKTGESLLIEVKSRPHRTLGEARSWGVWFPAAKIEPLLRLSQETGKPVMVVYFLGDGSILLGRLTADWLNKPTHAPVQRGNRSLGPNDPRNKAHVIDLHLGDDLTLATGPQPVRPQIKLPNT